MNKKKPNPFLSQSLIKSIIDNGTEIEFCPNKLYHQYIQKDNKSPTTLPQLRGLFFETMAIGGSAGGNSVYDLPRKNPTKKMLLKDPNAEGEKRISQLRLEEQAERFRHLAKKKNIIFGDFNTQTAIYKRHKETGVIFRGELDIGPTVLKLRSGIKAAIIDLKSTQNLTNTFGKYSWGNYVNMDKIQAKSYLWLLQDIDFELNDWLNPENNLRELFSDTLINLVNKGELIFIYWVFDYAPEMNQQMFSYKLNSTDVNDFHETIRKSVRILKEIHGNKYPTNAKPSLCSQCHIKDCVDRNDEEHEDPQYFERDATTNSQTELF